MVVVAVFAGSAPAILPDIIRIHGYFLKVKYVVHCYYLLISCLVVIAVFAPGAPLRIAALLYVLQFLKFKYLVHYDLLF